MPFSPRSLVLVGNQDYSQFLYWCYIHSCMYIGLLSMLIKGSILDYLILKYDNSSLCSLHAKELLSLLCLLILLLLTTSSLLRRCVQ
ncbi:nucleotidyltransferase [Zea mays]|uniref:Nucleotidyltransferase n=1 Tax=Zea mays TaxID=4577 RepID=A0A1D6PHL3_MAIZE|nr:nucleotidyltransferase [Zea mays]